MVRLLNECSLIPNFFFKNLEWGGYIKIKEQPNTGYLLPYPKVSFHH
jgi:hypothetical protein